MERVVIIDIGGIELPSVYIVYHRTWSSHINEWQEQNMG